MRINEACQLCVIAISDANCFIQNRTNIYLNIWQNILTHSIRDNKECPHHWVKAFSCMLGFAYIIVLKRTLHYYRSIVWARSGPTLTMVMGRSRAFSRYAM